MSQCQPVIDMSGVQQKGGVQLDRRLQLANHPRSFRHSWRLWGGQVNTWDHSLDCLDFLKPVSRFYLGHWQEGIGKLFSFGGLGVWTLVDVVLVAIGYIGPADGSLYI